MSKQSQSVQAAMRPGITLGSETIYSITEKLQELTQAFASLCQDESLDSPLDESPAKCKEPDQTRCYQIPGYMVEIERKTLEENRAEDLLDLLHQTHEDFCLTSFLLRHICEDVKLTGFTLQQIGERLDRPVRTLNRLCSIFADYQLQTSIETDDAIS